MLLLIFALFLAFFTPLPGSSTGALAAVWQPLAPAAPAGEFRVGVQGRALRIADEGAGDQTLYAWEGTMRLAAVSGADGGQAAQAAFSGSGLNWTMQFPFDSSGALAHSAPSGGEAGRPEGMPEAVAAGLPEAAPAWFVEAAFPPRPPRPVSVGHSWPAGRRFSLVPDQPPPPGQPADGEFTLLALFEDGSALVGGRYEMTAAEPNGNRTAARREGRARFDAGGGLCWAYWSTVSETYREGRLERQTILTFGLERTDAEASSCSAAASEDWSRELARASAGPWRKRDLAALGMQLHIPEGWRISGEDGETVLVTAPVADASLVIERISPGPGAAPAADLSALMTGAQDAEFDTSRPGGGGDAVQPAVLAGRRAAASEYQWTHPIRGERTRRVVVAHTAEGMLAAGFETSRETFWPLAGLFERILASLRSDAGLSASQPDS